MATTALPDTALKMKNTNTTAKTKTSALSPGGDLKKPTDRPDILEPYVNNASQSSRVGKKGQEKEPDKENLVHSAPEEEEEEEEGEGEDDEVAIIGTPTQAGDSAKQKDPIRRKKINEFIMDRSYRMRSFLRRRGVPLVRTLEMDIQACTTKMSKITGTGNLQKKCLLHLCKAFLTHQFFGLIFFLIV
jgi:hypothetical protein